MKDLKGIVRDILMAIPESTKTVEEHRRKLEEEYREFYRN